MNYNLDYVSDHLRELVYQSNAKTHKFDSSLSYISYENAFIAPYVDWNLSIGCVLDKNGKVIKDSECYEWKENDYCYDISDAIVEHRSVIFLGFLVTVFGHAFTDNLRKAWFLKLDICKQLLDNGAEIVYTTSGNRQLPDWMVYAFSLAGIDISRARIINRLTVFDTVIVPDNSIFAIGSTRLYGMEYVGIINSIKQKCYQDEDLPGYEKVYFSRLKLKHSRDVGERSIIKYFKRVGYMIVAPERLPLLDQIRIMHYCSFFASTEGSVAHLTLFCRPGTNVVLINKAEYINPHQVMINEFANLSVTYIDAHYSSLANRHYPWWGPFYLYPSRFLKRFFGGKHGCLPFLRVDYWYYLLIYNNLTNKLKPIVYKIIKRVSDSFLFSDDASTTPVSGSSIHPPSILS